MGHTVVIAEKPSVGRDIARVLGCRTRGEGCLTGGDWIVTWAVGHLVTLVEPDELDERYKRWQMSTLPILPEDIPLKVISSSRKQFQIVKKLICDSDTDRLICATDAGREGELIFRYIYMKSGCKKPFDRLWISSMTDEAIQEGFRQIRPGAQYDGLFRSAQCRSQADWLVGMNASRAFTLRYDTLLSVGRVQTPTLAILVKRRKEIEQFKPEEYATVTADFGDYKGMYFSEKLDPDTHIPKPEEAKRIADDVKGRQATVRSAETTRKRDLPPQLYDLTSLQRDANRLLGFTADKTLKLAQSLYETRKALTYPRTDSRHLPPDMIPRVVQTMKLLPDSYQALVPGALPNGKLPVTKRTVDETKVTDHHAIIPTAKKVDPATFPEDERRLYDLVARRMLAAFYPPCEYDATKVITQVDEHSFRTNGRTVLANGWKDVPPLENPPKPRKKAKAADEEDEAVLPPLSAGDTRTVKDAAIQQDKTKPPSMHTDASLLAAMENAGRELEDEELQRQMKGSGIGTPATRAAIIERLMQVGYAQRKGKTIAATDKGVQLIDIMPQEIASPEMTGRWELALDRITDGQQDAAKFMESIRRFSTFLVDYARTNDKQASFPEEDRRRKGKGRGKAFPSKPVEGAVCPVCGQGGVVETQLAFSCSRTSDGCHFTLWKDCLTRGGGPELTDKLIRLLLEKRTLQGSTGVVSLADGRIAFQPNDRPEPTVSRSILYQKTRR
ncbi:MAG: DNA topoisomerase 3 [Christensenellaceae bacterium]|nr:DNA topoisomerase 3 [Christensenellaceae bacterium]